MAKLAKKIVTSEDVSLLRVTGQGEVWFAGDAGYVFLLELENEGISANFRNLLTFDSSLTWDINRTKGAGMMPGGLFNPTAGGTGPLAAPTVAKPPHSASSQPPVYFGPNTGSA